MTEHDGIIAKMAQLEAALREAREVRPVVSCALCWDEGELVDKNGETVPCFDCDV